MSDIGDIASEIYDDVGDDNTIERALDWSR